LFGLDLFALLVIGFIALAAVVLVVMIVFFAVTVSRNREVARLAGVDTVEGRAQAVRSVVDGFAAQAGGPAPAASRSIETRLHELEGLRARGVISYDEYLSARQRAIEGGPSSR